MKISNSPQGSLEWHQDRAGCITASMFVVVRKLVGGLTAQQQKYVNALIDNQPEIVARRIAGYKSAPRAAGIDSALLGKRVGDYSDAAKNYAFRLAIERISGEPLDEGFQTYAMKRGHELEEDCRIRHENDIAMLVETAGFVTTDDEKYGCSADSLVEQDGGGEYKCFIAPDKLRPIIIEDDWGDIMDQVQGCMWITGRKWWDMCLYCPALAKANKDFVRKRVNRDDDYIEKMELDLIHFEKTVTEWEFKLRNQEQAA